MSSDDDIKYDKGFVKGILPHVISPLNDSPVLVGWKDIPIELLVMVPSLNKLSVTVEMTLEVAGDRVPTVRSTGPMLG